MESNKYVNLFYNKWINNFFFKFLIVIIFSAVFFSMGFIGQNIEYDASASIDKILKDDDPFLMQYNQFKEDFGSNENIIIAFETNNIYSNKFLSFLISISEKLDKVDGVQDVVSLSTLSDIYGEDGELLIAPFIEKESIPYSQQALIGLKTYYATHPFVENKLVDEKGETAVIYIQVAPDVMKDDLKQESFANLIRNTTNKFIADSKRDDDLQVKAHFVGGPIVSAKISEIQHGEGWITTVMIVSLSVILLLVFRSISGAVLPVFIAMTSISFIMGLKTVMHSSFSTIDGLLYALIFTISVGDSVHIISAWHNPLNTITTDKVQRMRSILNHIFIPCFFTSLTTAVGFGAISLSGIPQLKDFGLYSSISVVFAFIMTLTYIPATLTLNKKTKPNKVLAVEDKKDSLFEKVCKKSSELIHKTTYRHAKSIVIIFLVIFCVAVFGIYHIKVGTNSYSFLKDSTDVNIALNYIEDRVCGIDDLEIIVSAPQDVDEAFKDPQYLKMIAEFQEYVTSFESVSESNSIVYFVKLMNRAITEDERQYTIPETRAMIAQLIFLYEISGEPETLSKWVSDDYNTLRINLKVQNNSKLSHLMNDIEEYTKQKDFPFTYQVTGSAMIWNRVDSVFLKSQVKSLCFSIFFITLILFLIFRSIKLGIISFIVNFFPIIVGFGILGFSGIGLNMGTVLIAPIAIGIAVDDTIHFLVQFKLHNKVGSDLQETLANVFKIVFKPIVFTSVILAVGFSSNVVSNFKPNAYFGIVSAITLLVAMITDLFLLPALLVLLRRNPLDTKR